MEKIFAENLQLPDGTSINDPTGFTDIAGLIAKFLPYIYAAAGFGLLLMIVSGGFTLLTSAGDAKKMEMGKQRLTNALVGFIIVFAAFWLVQIAGYVFGIQEIKDIFGGP